MYFVDLKGLTVHLQNNKPTSRESFHYVLAYMGSGMFEGAFSKFYSSKPAQPPANITEFLINMLVLLVLFFITYLILLGYYRKNGGDNGKFFLDRLIAIVWVVGFRVGIILLPLIAAFYMFKEHIPSVLLIALVILIFASFIYMFLTIRSTFEKIRIGSVVD